MSSLVGEYQFSFILGHQGVDNIVVVQEIMHSMRKKMGKVEWMAAIKLDLEKAHDRISWEFLNEV